MKFAPPVQRHWAQLQRLLLALLSLGTAIGDPNCLADPPSGTTLEDYLKRLGYEAVEFQRTDQAQDFVEGVLSNGRKRTFLVDTGWGMTALSKSAASGLKHLSEIEGSQHDRLVGIITNRETILIDKLRLGRVQFFNQPARVEDLRADYIRLPFDAVLGCDFFFRNFCLIDCYKRRLYVRSAKPSEEQTKALEETLHLSGFTPVPIDSKFLLTVQAEINGQPVRLALDTGAAFDELDDSQLKRLGLTTLRSDQAATGSLIPSELSANVVGVGSIGGHKLSVTRPNTFRIGPRNWQNMYFGITDLKAWGLAKPETAGEPVKGLLCQITLQIHGALIDIAHQKLWLRPEKPSR